MKTIQRDRVEQGIEVLRLDRPQRRNAMDSAMLAEIVESLHELSCDEELRALIFSTTNVDGLCAGADVSEPLDEAGGVARMEAFARFYAAVDAFPLPTIAVCVGDCVGAGAELTIGCDLRVGGENLKLAWPGARLGVPVGPARLTPLVGLARAKELIFTGRTIDAQEAASIGLLHAVVATEDAESAALELARSIARRPVEGTRTLKRMFSELEHTDARIAYENDRLLDFQRHGPGLPSGGNAAGASRGSS